MKVRQMAGTSRTTTEHDEIRRWVEAGAGCPVAIRDAADGDHPGVLWIAFPGRSSHRFEVLGWDEWLTKFDDDGLALLYQTQEADGSASTCFKLVRADRRSRRDAPDGRWR
jgi:hypothetical protein